VISSGINEVVKLKELSSEKIQDRLIAGNSKRAAVVLKYLKMHVRLIRSAGNGAFFAAILCIYFVAQYQVFDIDYYGVIVVYTLVTVDSLGMYAAIQLGLLFQYWIIANVKSYDQNTELDPEGAFIIPITNSSINQYQPLSQGDEDSNFRDTQNVKNRNTKFSLQKLS